MVPPLGSGGKIHLGVCVCGGGGGVVLQWLWNLLFWLNMTYFIMKWQAEVCHMTWIKHRVSYCLVLLMSSSCCIHNCTTTTHGGNNILNGLHWHSFCKAKNSSCSVSGRGFLWPTLQSRMCQRCSIGDTSADLAGHAKTWTLLCCRKSWQTCAVCGLALPCWRYH